MPITSFVDYLPVMDEFIAHWSDTDAELVLPENNTATELSDFTGLRGTLDDIKAQLQVRLNDLENARIALDQLRLTAGDHIANFNRRLRADFPNNQLFNRLPPVPNRTAGRDAFVTALDDVLDLWSRVNAQPASPLFTPPLLLLGNLTRAQLVTLRTSVDAAFTTRGNLERTLSETRINRNRSQDRARELMRLYRLRIEGLYAPDSTTVLTLPRLTPLPGHTPQPVILSGNYDLTDARAELTWTASSDPDLATYELRSTPGPEYSAEDETTLAALPPGGPLAYQTSTGLATPGSAVTYKLYVRLTTGNEAGSDPLTITRPV